MNEYDEKLISFSPERLTLCCKFASPVGINPVCLQITCIKAKDIFFQDVHFIFITKIYFIMFGVRIVIKLMIFIIYVFKHIHRLITLTLFYIKAMPASFFNAISNNIQMQIALNYHSVPISIQDIQSCLQTYKKTFFYFCSYNIAYQQSSIKK